LKQLIEAKQQGRTIEVAAETKRAPVIDMMTALKRSLAASSASGSTEKKDTKAKPKRHALAKKAS
jgi:non-homologous end joining protein Ku